MSMLKLKRTPPQTPTSASAPNISALELDTQVAQTSCENVTLRSLKRSRDDFAELKEYLLDIVTASKQEQNAKLNTLISAVSEIKEQNNDIRNSVEFVSAKYDELATKVSSLEEERKHDRAYIKDLETRVEILERQIKSSSLELRNVPCQKNETREYLLNIVKATGSALDIRVEPSDIKNVYRVPGKTEDNKPIVAELNSVGLKDNLIRAVKAHNKRNPENKFSTSNLNLNGPSKPVYISESLSSKTKKLFYLARNAASANGYKFCWVYNGKVFLRKSEGSPQIRIGSEEDLNCAITQ